MIFIKNNLLDILFLCDICITMIKGENASNGVDKIGGRTAKITIGGYQLVAIGGCHSIEGEIV